MTLEEIRARAIAAEKRKKHEYYLANRERITAKMREYARTHRDQLRPHEKKWRENHPVEYLQSQVNHWTRKMTEDPENKKIRTMLNCYTKKLNEERQKQENEHTTN